MRETKGREKEREQKAARGQGLVDARNDSEMKLGINNVSERWKQFKLLEAHKNGYLQMMTSSSSSAPLAWQQVNGKGIRSPHEDNEANAQRYGPPLRRPLYDVRALWDIHDDKSLNRMRSDMPDLSKD